MNSHFTANANKASRYHNVSYILNIDTWYFHIFTFCAVFEYICSLSPWLKSLIDWLDLHRANFCT